jgi:hypothetical protein
VRLLDDGARLPDDGARLPDDGARVLDEDDIYKHKDKIGVSNK